MKKTIFQRKISFLIAFTMLFTSTTTALASEDANSVIDTTMEVINVSNDNTGINAIKNDIVHDVVPANGTANLYPKLESYVGFTKTFFVNVTSPSSKAGVFLYLYDPDGKLVSDDWIMGLNQAASWNIILPKSGTWRLYVVGLATEDYAEVYAGWK